MAVRKQDTESSVSPLIQSFPPVAYKEAKILILGSMPGIASLEAGQYYAHPRNLFWDIIEEITGIPRQTPYEDRTKELAKSGIALWDVLQSCIREGSLDSNIQHEVPNDLQNFLYTHNRIERICFNGKKAEASFQRYIRTLGNTEDITGARQLLTLPSTSPANASIPYEIKLENWGKALKTL